MSICLIAILSVNILLHYCSIPLYYKNLDVRPISYTTSNFDDIKIPGIAVVMFQTNNT